MKCPFCQNYDSKVVDSRACDYGEKIKRRRECLNCNSRFTTYEIIEYIPIIVIKKDNSKEIFDKNKILTSMI
ncbi:MAG: transcriptional regulator NrdR, partial [Oscillospiraceae bacterium]